jgi:hypothetical protein
MRVGVKPVEWSHRKDFVSLVFCCLNFNLRKQKQMLNEPKERPSRSALKILNRLMVSCLHISVLPKDYGCKIFQ